MDIVSVENKVGKWQLHSAVVLGKEVLKHCFHLIILMHDPACLILSSDDISICSMFAVLDICNLIISSVASDMYEERENIKLSVFGGWWWFFSYQAV